MKKGLAGRILKINPKALYTHCFSHRLNLAVCNSCNVLMVRNVMDNIRKVTEFFNYSIPRLSVLTKYIEKHFPELKGGKLKDPCKTRWIERIHALDSFLKEFLAICEALEEIKDSRGTSASDAASLLKLIKNFEFIVALIVTQSVFSNTYIVTRMLQNSMIDVKCAIDLIHSLLRVFSDLRSNIDASHNELYNKALVLAEKADVEECARRTVNRQNYRDNAPSTTTSDHFKKVITIPVIDHVEMALKDRFNEDTMVILNGLSVIPKCVVDSLNNGKDQMSWRERFKKFTDFYNQDFPSPLAIDGECEMWETYWKAQTELPDNLSSTLKSIPNLEKIFVNIFVALKLLATSPVTSCGCERSFSALRRLKTWQRSTMTEERLNGLALMQIHRDHVPDIQEVMAKFLSKGNRKLDLKL